MRSVIGMVVGVVTILATILLESAHHFELIEELIPEWLKPMINEKVNFGLILVGILIFLAAYFDHKFENQKHNQSRKEEIKPHPVASAPTVATTQTANPVTTQKVEIHNYPHPTQGYAVQERSKDVPPMHNVRCLGAKSIWTHFEREVFDKEDGVPGVKVSFLNESIPGVKISDFDYAKARIVIQNTSGVEVAATAKPVWLNHDINAAVHIEANCTESILLAVHGNGDQWVMPFLSLAPKGYWDDGSSGLIIDAQPLPFGEFEAHITLVNEDSIGISPVVARFSLGSQGKVQIMPQ